RVLCMAVMLLAVLNLATCPIFGVHFICCFELPLHGGTNQNKENPVNPVQLELGEELSEGKGVRS
ncbi:MAG: hypothetical protein LGR52_06295, partial [Candidatus Thiosymbion ectosymbiont of Robbea hypermnestra]|nr:hypothetical protein [Candidatus Thiosymbion ectosymbiont of Robbea hypermnestra]